MVLVIVVVVAAVGALWLTRRPKEAPAPEPAPSLSERMGKLARRGRQAVTLVAAVWVVAALTDGCDEARETGDGPARVPCTAYHAEDCPLAPTTTAGGAGAATGP